MTDLPFRYTIDFRDIEREITVGFLSLPSLPEVGDHVRVRKKHYKVHERIWNLDETESPANPQVVVLVRPVDPLTLPRRPRQFRHHSEVVRADQWDGVPNPDRWGWAKNSEGWAIAREVSTGEYSVQAEAGEPWVPLNVGDWVVQDGDGRFAVANDRDIRDEYEPID